MRGLDIDAENLKNQQDVVKNEVRVNVLNQPYGGFPWIDLPHGREQELVQRAQLLRRPRSTSTRRRSTTCSEFFKTFYAPNNAVLVVVGRLRRGTGEDAGSQKYFAGIPSATLPPPPDLTEPRQEKEKRAGRDDPLATRPALGIAYHVPDRATRRNGTRSA